MSKNKSNDKNKNGFKKINYDISEKDFLFSYASLKEVKFVPRNLKQKDCMDSMAKNTISFNIGKVGSGKTTLAVIFAINELAKGNKKKIILIRPKTTTSDEELGYLSGDMQEKIAPLILPMKDVFIELLGSDMFEKLVEEIKIDPFALAFVQGRTFKNSVVIVDESQNISKRTFRDILTRIDDSSKMIICGDLEQTNLKDPNDSAFTDLKRFKNKPMIGFTEFNSDEVVRGKITRIIEQCYDDMELLKPLLNKDPFEQYQPSSEPITEVYETSRYY